MANPLVAQAPQEGSGFNQGTGDNGWAGGISIAESAMDTFNGFKDGNWIEGGLGVVGLAADAASMAIDPFGTLLSSAASFLMEHVQPLKDMLDWLAGDPPVIESYSTTWNNVSTEMGKISQDYAAALASGTEGWTGAAADAYRAGAAQQGDALTGAASAAGSVGTVVGVMGMVVAFVREMVRDLIADLVAKLITWVLEAAFSLGFGTPVIVAQAITAISKWAARIAKLVQKLLDTIKKVSPMLKRLVEIFEKIMKVLGKLAGKATGLDVLGTKMDDPGFLRRLGRDGVDGPSGTPGGGPDAPSSRPDGDPAPGSQPDGNAPASSRPDSGATPSSRPDSTSPASTTPSTSADTPSTRSPDGGTPPSRGTTSSPGDTTPSSTTPTSPTATPSAPNSAPAPHSSAPTSRSTSGQNPDSTPSGHNPSNSPGSTPSAHSPSPSLSHTSNGPGSAPSGHSPGSTPSAPSSPSVHNPSGSPSPTPSSTPTASPVRPDQTHSSATTTPDAPPSRVDQPHSASHRDTNPSSAPPQQGPVAGGPPHGGSPPGGPPSVGGPPRTGGGGWTGTSGHRGDTASGVPQSRTPDGAPRPQSAAPHAGPPQARPPYAGPPHAGPVRPPQAGPPHAGPPQTRPPHQAPPQAPHQNTPYQPQPRGPVAPHHTPDSPAHHPGPDSPPHHQPEPRPNIDEAHARHGETTPAGVSHHRGDSDMGDLPSRVPNDPRYFTADVHITPDGRARVGNHSYSPEEYGDLLRRNGWDGKTPIRLIGCDAGSNDFAKRLSAHTDAPVLAPTKPAWTDSQGRVYTSDAEVDAHGNRQPKIPPNGEWETHQPDGTKAKSSEDGFVPGTHDKDKTNLDPNDAKDRAAQPGERERPTHHDIDWQEPRHTRTESTTVKSGEPFYDPPDFPRKLDPETKYTITDDTGRRTTVYTNAADPPRITHVEAHTPNTRTGTPDNPMANPDASRTLPDVDYRVHAGGEPFTFHTDADGKPAFDVDGFNAPKGPDYDPPSGEKYERVDDWDPHQTPFSNRTDLEPDRRYDVYRVGPDGNELWHGTFHTSPERTPDGESQFTHIDTWTDKNPELGDRNTMRQHDQSNPEGLPLADTRVQVDDRVFHTDSVGNAAVSYQPHYGAPNIPPRDGVVQGRTGHAGEFEYPDTKYRGGHGQDHISNSVNEAIGVVPQLYRENNLLRTTTDPLSPYHDSWRQMEIDRKAAHDAGVQVERVRVWPTEPSQGLVPDRLYVVEQRVDPVTGKPVVHYRSFDNVPPGTPGSTVPPGTGSGASANQS